VWHLSTQYAAPAPCLPALLGECRGGFRAYGEKVLAALDEAVGGNTDLAKAPVRLRRGGWSHELQYSAVQYSPVQCSTVQCSAVQYSTVQYSAVQYSTVQYSTLQYSTVQYSTVQYNTEQDITGHDSTVQFCTVVPVAIFHGRPA